jgi:cytoskeleton protein RodZ
MARKPKESDEKIVEKSLTESTAAEFSQTQNHSTQHYSRCGGVLKLEREKQGLSVQDICSRLKLSPKQIAALEADHFDKLPEPTIIRGFIRNYAKLLKLDSTPLLEAYDTLSPKALPQLMTVEPTKHRSIIGENKPSLKNYFLMAIGLFVAAGIWFLFHTYVQKPNPSQPTTQKVLPVEAATTEEIAISQLPPEAALPMTERQAELPESGLTTPTNDNLAKPAAIAPNDVALPSAQTSEVQANVVKSIPAPPDSANPLQLKSDNKLKANADVNIASQNDLSTNTPLADDNLNNTLNNNISKIEFTATQETWINVTDASGKTIYSKLLYGGSRETIEAKLPLKVKVGNAGATTMLSNGKTVNLAPYTRNNVAKITLENN